jgi:dTDP-glucose 4,6-dehydratase
MLLEQQHANMRILVTGGCGFIASHLVKHLVKTYPHYYIVNLDKLDTCSSIHNHASVIGCSNYKFIPGDITSADLVNYILATEEINTIVHAAAQSHVDASFGNSFAFTHNNVYGTHVLLEAAKKAGIGRFIHVSTDEVYGSCDADRKCEASATNPTNPYAASKAAAESIVRGYINSFSFPAIITRGNNVYGPNQYVEKLIPKFISRLLRNQKCCIHGDGSNRRHYLHVLDTVSALDLVLHKGLGGETYNIGSLEEITNFELAKKIIRLLKREEPEDWIEYVPDRAFNDSRYYLTFDKLTKLGWKPKYTLDDALPEVIKWYKETDIVSHWSDHALVALQAHPKI